MKIGLLRHHKVRHKFPFFCNSTGYDREYARYENAEISHHSRMADVTDYTMCFSSDSKRAVETAGKIWQGDAGSTPLLKEVPLKSLFRTGMKIPFFTWYVMDRLAWFFNKKDHVETRKQTLKRASDFLDDLLKKHSDQHVLIVSHGFFMLTLRRQLLKMGFEGDRIIPARNGRLYRFEKN